MRQILILGLLGAVGWWLYDVYFAEPALAAPPDDGPAAVAPDGTPQSPAPLAQVLGAVQPPQQAQRTPADPALDADGKQALDALVAGIGRCEVAAVTQGWKALQSGQLPADPARQLLEALTKDGEFEVMLARLGRTNAFLHHAAGRTLVDKVFQAAMALADPAAVSGGTRVLEACLRGDIQKQQVAIREHVDRLYATYRVRADRWICDPQNVAGARSYTVASGDSLNRIARKFRKEGILVDEGTIAVLNRIHNKNAIQLDQRLKIPVDPVHVIVEKRSFSLGVYVGDQLLRLYWVGLGENDKTPVTTFEVAEKQPRPEWTAPDGRVLPYGHHENILGEYFIKFRNPSYTGFGAHGTPQPETIGTMSSAGCIRMYSPDITELFEILPRGAKVEIRATEA